MDLKFQYPSKQAYSLIEILVSITIITVLIALLFTVSSSFIEKSESVKCASQLRQIGHLLHAYLGERNQRLLFTRDGAGRHLWYNELKSSADLSDGDARQLFRCPSVPMSGIPANLDAWYCYGFRLDYTQPTYLDLARVFRENGEGLYELYVNRVEKPASFYIMADTIDKNSRRQTMRIIPRDGGIYNGHKDPEGIHLRHQNRANVLFLDGHIESLDEHGFHALGITHTFGADMKIISTQP